MGLVLLVVDVEPGGYLSIKIHSVERDHSVVYVHGFALRQYSAALVQDSHRNFRASFQKFELE